MEAFISALRNDKNFRKAIFDFTGEDSYDKIIEFSASKGITISKTDLQQLDASIEQFNNLPEDQREALIADVDDAALIAASGGDYSAGKAIGTGLGAGATTAAIAGGTYVVTGILEGIGTAIMIK